MKTVGFKILVLISCLLTGCAATMDVARVNGSQQPANNEIKSRFGSNAIEVIYQYSLDDENIEIIDIAQRPVKGQSKFHDITGEYYKQNQAELESTRKVKDCIVIKAKNGNVDYSATRWVKSNQLSIYTQNTLNIPGLIVEIILSPLGIPLSILSMGSSSPINPFENSVHKWPDHERVNMFGRAVQNKIEQDANLCKVNDSDISSWYKGDCKDGKAHGRGLAIGKARYEGEFVAGRKQGIGEYITAGGTNRSGYYFNDAECTESEYKYKSDKQYARKVDLENYRAAFQAADSSTAWQAFISKYQSYDPDKLLAKARVKLAESKRQEALTSYRNSFNNARTSADYSHFIQKYANSDPEHLIPKAQTKKQEMLQREKSEYQSVSRRSWSSGYKVKVTYETAPGQAVAVLQKIKDAMHVRDPFGVWNPYWVTDFPAAAAYDDRGVIIGEWYTNYYEGWSDWRGYLQKIMSDLMNQQNIVYSWAAEPMGETVRPYTSYPQSSENGTATTSAPDSSSAVSTRESPNASVSGEYKIVKSFPIKDQRYSQVVAEVICSNGNKGFIAYNPSESYHKYKAPNGTFESLKLATGPTIEGVAKESCR